MVSLCALGFFGNHCFAVLLRHLHQLLGRDWRTANRRTPSVSDLRRYICRNGLLKRYLWYWRLLLWLLLLLSEVRILQDLDRWLLRCLTLA